jgi:hypothetical protein
VLPDITAAPHPAVKTTSHNKKESLIQFFLRSSMAYMGSRMTSFAYRSINGRDLISPERISSHPKCAQKSLGAANEDPDRHQQNGGAADGQLPTKPVKTAKNMSPPPQRCAQASVGTRNYDA